MTKDLLFSITKRDFEMKFIRCSGPGGQKVNKTNSGVFLKHIPSGAYVKSTSERSQDANRRNAMARIVKEPKFKSWLYSVIAELDTGQTLEEKVDAEMTSDKTKVEVMNSDGKWEEEK
jgi:hypothetical protein